VDEPKQALALKKPISRKVLVFLSPARRKRDVGAAIANGDRM
jgi:hypothetical protein